MCLYGSASKIMRQSLLFKTAEDCEISHRAEKCRILRISLCESYELDPSAAAPAPDLPFGFLIMIRTAP